MGSHFEYLKIYRTVEAEHSLIVIKNSRGLNICIIVVDRQLLIAYRNACDRLEFTLQKNISLLDLYSTITPKTFSWEMES